MLSVAPLHAPQPAPRPAQLLPGQWRGVLNALRVVALRCRVAARTDLFEACALIANTPGAAQDAYAQALFQCLREAITTKPVFFQPGTVELSFDEAWLVRALMAAAQNDGDSLTFLIRSRVAKIHQRHISFLINGIAAEFSKN
ncbi:hypothetical protein BC777_3473 [Yoonia maricola]|uniref:Uncharacterized protein n=1 Tax=Yoonia maricola TaxID=420999 RepID=A0A2M8W0I3_9RHOB|nr:hypothetical protein [Yoonia maricola]PJI84415.1 hypothetical protein BC777_3473 [Yoonia maricola]